MSVEEYIKHRQLNVGNDLVIGDDVSLKIYSRKRKQYIYIEDCKTIVLGEKLPKKRKVLSGSLDFDNENRSQNKLCLRIEVA